jgi:hypothetical protein
VPALEKEHTLKARLLAVMRVKIETINPYHEFAGALFKTAANPGSPLNPFSDETDPVRQESIELFAKVSKAQRLASQRICWRTSLPALGLSHGDHSVLDSRSFTQTPQNLSTY